MSLRNRVKLGMVKRKLLNYLKVFLLVQTATGSREERRTNKLQYLQQHTNNVCFAGEAHEVVNMKTEAGEEVVS